MYDPEVRKEYHERNKEKDNQQNREWYAQNRESRLAAIKRHKQKLRDTVLEAYGNCCACCGETEPKFLTLDHVNNDGYKYKGTDQRGGPGLYRFAIKQGFPDIFQILCWNCNMSKSRYKQCPHQGNTDPNRDKGGNSGSKSPSQRSPRSKGE